jgi:hypothetical protein
LLLIALYLPCLKLPAEFFHKHKTLHVPLHTYSLSSLLLCSSFIGSGSRFSLASCTGCSSMQITGRLSSYRRWYTSRAVCGRGLFALPNVGPWSWCLQAVVVHPELIVADRFFLSSLVSSCE